MSAFWFLTTSNKPRLRDLTAAQSIIAKYGFDFDCTVTIERDRLGQPRLSIDGDGWPCAWLLPSGGARAKFVPDYATADGKEFPTFLAEIAPLLAEPLLVQAIGTVTGEFPLHACLWRADPAGSVRVTDFSSTIGTDHAVGPVLAFA